MPGRRTSPAAVPPLVLREVRTAEESASVCGALGLAGAPRDGSLFVFTDLAAAPGAPPAACALVVPSGGGVAELRHFSVQPTVCEAALGPRLLTCLADRLRAAGCNQLVTAVSATDAERLDALQSVGFRRLDGTGDGTARLELPL